MTKQKILFLTVFFCLTPVVSLFALSKEATEVIEAFRERAMKDANTLVFSSRNPDEYIPGRELAMALSRVKRSRYSRKKHLGGFSIQDDIIASKPLISLTKTNRVNDKEANSSEDLLPNDDEKNEIKSSTQSIPEVQEEVEEEEEESNVIEEETSENEEELVSDETSNDNIPEEKKHYQPGKLLEESLNKVREINNKKSYREPSSSTNLKDFHQDNSQELMQKANREIDEIFNNPKWREEIAEQERQKRSIHALAASDKEINNDIDTNTDSNNSDSDNNKIDDQRFNDYIKKYNFKMPENYRIIVE